MASAMINGLITEVSPAGLKASDPSEAALSQLRNLGLTAVSTSPEGIFEGADLVVAAVRHNHPRRAVSDQRPVSLTHLLSIAAGLPTASLQAYAGPDVPIIRCMPNTPAMIGLGASALFAAETVNEAHRALAEQVTSAAGTTVWVEDEALLDVVTAVSGSGLLTSSH